MILKILLVSKKKTESGRQEKPNPKSTLENPLGTISGSELIKFTIIYFLAIKK